MARARVLLKAPGIEANIECGFKLP